MIAEQSEERAKRVNLKVIQSENYYQVNICDSNLIGQKLNEVTISKDFYGNESSREVIMKELKKANLINALGEESINLLSEVHKDIDVIVINDVPHAQVFCIT